MQYLRSLLVCLFYYLVLHASIWINSLLQIIAREPSYAVYIVMGNTLHAIQIANRDHSFEDKLKEFRTNLTQLIPVSLCITIDVA